jgi:hypothetical protein
VKVWNLTPSTIEGQQRADFGSEHVVI